MWVEDPLDVQKKPVGIYMTQYKGLDVYFRLHVQFIIRKVSTEFGLVSTKNTRNYLERY